VDGEKWFILFTFKVYKSACVEHNDIGLGEVECDWNSFYVTPSINSLLCEGKITLCQLRTFRNKNIITLCNK
jgi:hypothetical protein